MKCSGQSRKDPSVQMRTKKSPYFNSVISSQHITHVDPEMGRALPCNFITHSINVGTWNVLSLESSSSKLYVNCHRICCRTLGSFEQVKQEFLENTRW